MQEEKSEREQGFGPWIEQCFFCNDVYRPSVFIPKENKTGYHACPRCLDTLDKGNIFYVEIGSGEDGKKFSKTGRYCVGTEMVTRKLFRPMKFVEEIISKGYVLVPRDVYEVLKLNRFGVQDAARN